MLEEISIVGYVAKCVLDKTHEKDFLKISIPVRTSYKKKDGQEVEYTNWYNIALFDEKQVDRFSGKLAKGSLVMVKGQPEFTTYTAKDGTPRVDVSIKAGFNGMFRVLKYADVPSSGTGAEDAPAPTDDFPY